MLAQWKFRGDIHRLKQGRQGKIMEQDKWIAIQLFSAKL